MRFPIPGLLLLCLGLFLVADLPTFAEETTANVVTNYKEATSPLDFGAPRLGADEDEEEEVEPLSRYRGKVVLIVNVASKCGYTPQYEGLQKLYETHKKDGLVILGFPCNEFGRQEPGDAEEIMTFCRENYGVTFPMFSKVRVLGRRATPLYRFLSSEETNKDFAGPIKWNFTKFLVSRDGAVVGRFESKVAPDDEKFLERVKEELAKKKQTS